MQKLIPSLIKEISLGESDKLVKKYKEELKRFYVGLGEYTQKVYLAQYNS